MSAAKRPTLRDTATLETDSNPDGPQVTENGYIGMTSDQRRAKWDSVAKSYSALQSKTADVEYMSCDIRTADLGIAADDAYSVFALANGTEPQTLINLNTTLTFLLTTNVSDQVPGFTSEFYDYLVRRLVNMYRANHFSFPADLTANECTAITSIVPDAKCYDN